MPRTAVVSPDAAVFNPKGLNTREVKKFPEKQMKEIFKRHDANGAGRLSMAEIQNAFDELGAYFPIYQAWRGLKKADGNRDGFVDQNELDDLVSYAIKLGYALRNKATPDQSPSVTN